MISTFNCFNDFFKLYEQLVASESCTSLKCPNLSTLSSIESPTTDQLEEFLGEISTMKKVGKHPNVVRLLGFCKQPLMMIMEFVPCGDLVR